jgi:hypothetical protein
MVPFGAASFTIKGNLTTTSSYPYVYVQYGYAPGYSYYFDYFSSSYESGSGNYLFDEVVYYPKAGYVYIGFYSAAITAGTVMIETRMCPTGLGGWNCTFNVYDATANPTFTQSLAIVNPATFPSAPYSSDTFAYVIATVTTPMVTTYANYTFTVQTGTSTTGYVYFTKDQFSDRTSSIYINSDRYNSLSAGSVVNIALTPADLAIPGTFVMGVENYGSAGTTLNVAVATTVASSTGQTTDSTAAATTGGDNTTGAASSVSACIAMIVLCFTALFF